MHMAVQAARASRAHAPTTTISNKYIGFALAVALLAVSISGARGEAYGDETFGRNPQVNLWKIDGQHQPSDLLTRALPKEAFTRHRCTIMGWRQEVARWANSRRAE